MSAYASTSFLTAQRDHSVWMSTFYTTGYGLAFPDLGGIQNSAIDVERLGERATAVNVVVSDYR